MERKPQSLANHAKYDPLFHFFVIPVFVFELGVLAWNLTRGPLSMSSVGHVVVALAALVAAFKIRIYGLKVQDRVIRLEERLRLATVLPDPLRSRIGELTEDQLIALRFAPDSELAALVEKALSGGLARKDIKSQIKNWRPDYFRV